MFILQHVLITDELCSLLARRELELEEEKKKGPVVDALKSTEERARAAERDARKAEIRAQNAEARATAAENSARSAEGKRLTNENRIRAAEEEVRKLVTEVGKTGKEKEDLQRKLGEKEEEVSSLQDELTDTKMRLRSEVNRYEKLSQVHAGVQKGLDLARKDAEGARSELENTRGELRRSEEVVESLKVEMEAAEAKAREDSLTSSTDAYIKGFMACRTRVQKYSTKTNLHFLKDWAESPRSLPEAEESYEIVEDDEEEDAAGEVAQPDPSSVDPQMDGGAGQLSSAVEVADVPSPEQGVDVSHPITKPSQQ